MLASTGVGNSTMGPTTVNSGASANSRASALVSAATTIIVWVSDDDCRFGAFRVGIKRSVAELLCPDSAGPLVEADGQAWVMTRRVFGLRPVCRAPRLLRYDDHSPDRTAPNTPMVGQRSPDRQSNRRTASRFLDRRAIRSSLIAQIAIGDINCPWRVGAADRIRTSCNDSMLSACGCRKVVRWF
jgi:hypothetical protein